MTKATFFRVLVAGTSLGAVSACRGADRPTGAPEHPSVVVTQWNDSTELFLEYPHLLAGEATGNWAIHLSDMKDFKPVTEGTLTVRFLRGGAEKERFTLGAPARDGIYLLDPVIAEAGSYEVELSLAGPQVSTVHSLPDVVVWQGAGALPEAANEDEAGVIGFLKEQQWMIDFAVEAATERDVALAVEAPGEILARDGAMARVSAPVSGIALAESNLDAPSVGQRVRAGDDLVVLSPTAGEGGYARMRGELERAEREAARAERLSAAGAIARKRVEEARRSLDVARAEMQGLGADVSDGFRLWLVAPISGVIAERTFVPGGRVEAGQPLFTVVDPSRVWLRVQMPPGAVGSLGRAGAPSFTVEGASRTFTADRVVSVGTVLDPGTRTVPAVFEAPNDDGSLRIGQFVRVTVPVGGTVRGVAIPNEAVLDESGTPVAYVQVGGESFERRVLALGESDGRRTQVLEGIRAGEMVVTTGAYQIRLASLSPEGFSGGHAH